MTGNVHVLFIQSARWRTWLATYIGEDFPQQRLIINDLVCVLKCITNNFLVLKWYLKLVTAILATMSFKTLIK
jgi:hypothetical protein